MHLTEIIENIQKLKRETDSKGFKKVLENILNLIVEIEEKNISEKEKINVQNKIGISLENIKTEQQAKNGFKKIRNFLNNEFGFVSANYYQTLGTGFGLAFGTGLGVVFGPMFDLQSGIVYGIIFGSGFGLIAGVVIGKQLDKKKELDNRVLINL